MISIEYIHKLLDVYNQLCRPLCQQTGIPQTSLDILMFLKNWNEYFYASLLTSSDANRTLPLALQFFTEAFSYDYTKLFAALTVVVLPGIILYACAQEQVQASVAASGVKG